MNRSYKELMQTRLKILTVTASLSIAAMVATVILKQTVLADAESEKITGMLPTFIAFTVIIIFRLISYRRILKDDRKLAKMEIAEYDELGRHIRLNASRMCIWLMTIILPVGTLIAYFFNHTVFLTLGFVLLALLLLYGGLKLIYTRIL